MAKAANILIIILELLGFRVSIGDRKWKIFAYYTQISNLITLVSSLVYVITGGAAWLRYTSACMLTMTFLVTLFILLPFGGGFRRLMLSGNGLYHHTLCPVLSVLSYVLWEEHAALWQVPVAITFVYGIVMMYLNYRECFDGPYPFFRVKQQSGLATVLWMAGLTGMITVIALVMRMVCVTGTYLLTHFELGSGDVCQEIRPRDTHQYRLHAEGISNSTLTRLRRNESVNTETIDKLCRILECDVGDIMEYRKE